MGIDTMNISSPMAQIRLSPEKRSPFYRRFINKDFPAHDLEEGYGSRLRSKVRLYDQKDGTTNDQILRDKIAGYFATDWAPHKDLPVDIIVLTGISGDTGSGAFIDIAVHAKKACPDPRNVTVYGYIMLPDTAEKFASDNAAKKRLHRNGYAALKELESYESIPMEEGRKEIIDSSIPGASVELNSYNIPYDHPTLISGDYCEAVSMIAETIINAAADNGGTFSMASFYACSSHRRFSKLARETVSRHGILNRDACPEDSHMYHSIGYAKASIPEKIVIPHVVGEVSRRLYRPAADGAVGSAANTATAFCTKEKSLSRQDYQNSMRHLLGLTPNQELKESSLWAKLNARMNSFCRLRDNTVDISYDDAVSGNVRNFMNGFGTTGAINRATEQMQAEIAKEFESIRTKAHMVMIDFGPRAIQYLYDGVGNPDEHGVKEDYTAFCLKTQIEFVRDKFMDQESGIAPGRPEPLSLMQRVIEHLLKARLDEWKEATRSCEEMNVRYGVCQNMKGANGIWQTAFVTPMTDFLWRTSRFADVLETMADYYEGVGKSLSTDDFQEFANQSGETNGINLCRDAVTYKWVKEEISDKLANIRVRDVKEALIKDFYSNTTEWTSNDEGVARKQFDEIMSKACAVGKYAGANNGMDLTITDYFSHVLDSVPDSKKQIEITNAVDLIFGQLMTKSKPCLKIKQGVNRICNGTIMLPRSLQAGTSGPMIYHAFLNKLAQTDVMIPNLVFSDVVDSIVCYQTSAADALSDIEDLELWEKDYEDVIDSTTHLHNGQYPTLHMDTGYSQYNELTMDETAEEKHITQQREAYPDLNIREDTRKELNNIYGTGLAWRHYPSINVSRYGNNFSGAGRRLEVAYRRDVFSKKIEEALRLGVIECEREGNIYKYYINLIPRGWTDFNIEEYENKYNEGPKKGLFVRGKELFDYLAQQNREVAEAYRRQIFLYDSPFFDQNGFDFTEIIRVENLSQERIDREHKSYMMRMMRKSTGLYQDMEDTLFKLQPVEYELEQKEIRVLKRARYRKFFDGYMSGLVNSDEKGLEWTAIVDDSGEKEKLTKFSRIMLRGLDDIDRKLVMDKLKLYYIYQQYDKICDEYHLTDEDLGRIQNVVIGNTSEEAQKELLETRTASLKEELAVYKEKYGKKHDPLKAIMKAYGLVENQIDEVQPVIDFYESLDEVFGEMDNLT